MEILPIIYLSYMFIALYMFFLFVIIYLRNKDDLYYYPKLSKNDKKFSISIITPAYNEEDCIEDTIKAVLSSKYPIKEMIIVNDNSKDKTVEIVKKMMKKYSNLKLINNKENIGKAKSLNKALKRAKGDLIAVIDSDSYPDKQAIGKMVGFFKQKDVGAVTSCVLVKYKDSFMRKLQGFEYSVIAFTRKLLEYVDGIWATPGPLSIYRRKLLFKIGGFDSSNLTEDIEITWRIVYNGYKAKMCIPAKVYSIAPKKVSTWFKQRIRWDIGGLQCVNKYKKFFLRRGMLGFFILPFFTLSLCLGLVGMGIFGYLFFTTVIGRFLYTKYTIAAGTSLVTLESLAITPTVLNFFGIILFLLGLFFTFVGLGIMGEKRGGFKNVLHILFYMAVYLTIYPFIMLVSIIKLSSYKIRRKKIGWGTK
jgi:cellulose synthase/poly-beta-1,6-N-acetylglucosamine synthase-like glycosyltransferase